MIDYKKLTVSFVACQSAGIIGSIFTVSSVKTWYPALIKPNFAPPNWLFGPAWITLYSLMAVSLYLIWKKGHNKKGVKLAFVYFLLHLGFNALWSIIFFGMRNPFLGFLEIILLWLMIIVCMVLFWPIDKKATYLLIPYLLWVSFASVLNFSIWQLNK